MFLNTTDAAMANATFSGFEDTLPKKIIKEMMYCILLIVSFTGNVLIVWVTSRDIRLRSTTNILIANMAVSDLLFPLFLMPKRIVDILYNNMWLTEGDFGIILCKLTNYLVGVSWVVSIYSCVFIALDRFYAVFHPLRGGLRRGKLKYIIPGIWIFSIAMFSIYFFIFTLVKIENSTSCILDLKKLGIVTLPQTRIHYIMMIALIIGIPFSIISFLYLRIALKLRRTTVPGQAGNTSSARERQMKNAIKMSFVIVSLLFLSYLPFSVALLLYLLGYLDSLSPTARNDFLFAVIFILRSSCSYNFFIYLVFTKAYRQNFKNLFSRCTCKNHEQAEVDGIEMNDLN